VAQFNAEERRLLADTAEVHVEFRPGQRIPIWIVVDGQDVYVRSVRGPAGRWYQAVSAGQPVRLYAGAHQWPIRGEHVTDQAEIARVSDAIRTKYEARWRGPTAGMLRQEVLPTTLRLSI
jgi:hypothetical protein